MGVPRIMTEVRQTVAMWEGRALDLESVAKDLERAGIPATECRDTADQLRHNANELKAGRRITLLPRLQNKPVTPDVKS